MDAVTAALRAAALQALQRDQDATAELEAGARVLRLTLDAHALEDGPPGDARGFAYAADRTASDASLLRQLASPEQRDALDGMTPGSVRLCTVDRDSQQFPAVVVGIDKGGSLGYAQVEQYGEALLSSAALHDLRPRTLRTIVPGAEEGLDDVRCLRAFLSGVGRALRQSGKTTSLETLTLVEPLAGRLTAFRTDLQQQYRDTEPPPGWRAEPDTWPIGYYPDGARLPDGTPRRSPFEERLDDRDFLTAFVAMPFAPEMEDVWRFGIQQPAYEARFRCERLDKVAYTGDVLEQIKRRIVDAHLVIADMTCANANVFLEIGFAWGKGRETVLLWNKSRLGPDGKPAPRPFDVNTQKTLEYGSVGELHDSLKRELQALYSVLRAKEQNQRRTAGS
jgi:hypothetical protein